MSKQSKIKGILKKKQLFVNAAFENQGKLSQFNLDLTLALTSADIPFLKLENPELRTYSKSTALISRFRMNTL
jgi:hypothetical protein